MRGLETGPSRGRCRGVAVPAFAPSLLVFETPKLTGFRSMICEKQFVPLDDQSLYCSEQ
jgi:hypothetical protein